MLLFLIETLYHGNHKIVHLFKNIYTSPTEQVPEKKRNYLYRLLRYEKVDKAGEVHYLKEPKGLFFMVIELIVKILLINTILLTFLGVYLKFAKGVLLNQQMIIGMIVIPIVCFVLFHYIRRNKFYKAMIINLINIKYSPLPHFISCAYQVVIPVNTMVLLINVEFIHRWIRVLFRVKLEKALE